ncbi:hypothetical protein SEA_VANLEE_157 [Gordonia phage VanLee]|uniref:Uncharacterized protein n=1 Tax=Gordonia phage VanLee TaxID=2845816 RepID=A0A8F2D9L4_9CAUD|nr:hypothetical protein QEH49_gp133 [Gordonia phage VanLee]QWS68273.1 hypothetical protein SEA_VANLEE_157 [Gordonia phage VanLee]
MSADEILNMIEGHIELEGLDISDEAYGHLEKAAELIAEAA